MSLVIGIKCKDGVLFGCDSIIIIGEDRKESVECASNAKIWNPVSQTPFNDLDSKQVNTSLLMGGVGTVRDTNVLKSQLVLPPVINMNEVIDVIVPEIRNVLIKNGFLSDAKPYENMESSFLLATKDQLFLIAHDYSVLEKKNVAVIGYCDGEAKNLLHQLLKDKDLDQITMEEAKKVITEVITLCSTSCTYVDLPVYFKCLTNK